MYKLEVTLNTLRSLNTWKNMSNGTSILYGVIVIAIVIV